MEFSKSVQKRLAAQTAGKPFVRSGGLLLCECHHVRTLHSPHPSFFGGPVVEGTRCRLCLCPEFKRSTDQGLTIVQGVKKA